MEESKNTLLGFLKDSNVSAMIRTRIANLIDAFGGNIPQFVGATHAQLEAAYNKAHPLKSGRERGLGQATFAAFDLLARRYRNSQYAVRQAAKETAKAEDAVRARDAETAKAAVAELLGREFDFDGLTTALAALSVLKIRKAPLGRIIEMYELAGTRE